MWCLRELPCQLVPANLSLENEMERRYHSNFGALCFGGMVVLAACNDSLGTGQNGDSSSAGDSAIIARVDRTSCNGLFREEDLIVAQRRVRRQVCYQVTQGGPIAPRESYAFVDDQGHAGTPFSFQDLRHFEAERAASVEGRVAPELRSILNKASSELVDVDLWYRFDEPPLVPKEELLASEARRAEYMQAYQAAMKRGRSAVERVIRGVGLPVQVLQSNYTAAPRLRVRASAAAIYGLAANPWITAITSSLESELAHENPHVDILQESELVENEFDPTDYFYDIDQIGYLRLNGWNGSNITVANLEGALPDSIWNLSLPSGSCPGGYVCACPQGGNANYHPRVVMGIIRNTVGGIGGLRGGTASDSRDVFANCLTGSFFSDQNATVINRSASSSTGNPQTSLDMYLDSMAVQAPYPLITISAGNNGPSVRVSNNLRNGLVVGGANDRGNPDRDALKNMYSGSQGANYGGASGWELPHLVAPAVNIASAGVLSQEIESRTGTSFAAPQVAGIAASLQEQTGLKYYPEALIPAFLVGPEQDVNGVWPLNLHDGIDDLDGVGAVNARLTSRALSKKVDGGQTPAELGFDHGWINQNIVPETSTFPEVYNVFVPAGRTLRAAAVILSRPTCGSPASTTNCTANPYPRFTLTAWMEVDFFPYALPVAMSDSLNQNYQYISIPPSTHDMTYKIAPYMRDWSGVTGTFYGIAFTSEE